MKNFKVFGQFSEKVKNLTVLINTEFYKELAGLEVAKGETGLRAAAAAAQ